MTRSIPTYILMTLALLHLLAADGYAATLFVDADLATGANDGSTWNDAFQGESGVQAALAAALSGDQIWVTGGTYKPTAGTDRSLSFNLTTDISMYGGFSGGEASPVERDIAANETTLSGDLLGNDGPGFTNRTDNSIHVVRISGNTTRLDGVTICGGNARDGVDVFDRQGGGLRFESTLLTFEMDRCRIVDNEADDGGGMLVMNSPTMRIVNSVIANNHASARGGGIASLNLTVGVAGARFINCLISGNVGGFGGGLQVEDTSIEFINCTVVSNQSTDFIDGGGLLGFGTVLDLKVSNCILWNNTGMGGNMNDLAQIRTPQVAAGFLMLNNTCVQNLSATLDSFGSNNTGGDPLFQDMLGPDAIAGTGDENLRLMSGSSSVDSGDNQYTNGEVTLDFDGLPRFVDDPNTVDTGLGTPPIVDMGAYELQQDAEPVPTVGFWANLAFILTLLITGTIFLQRSAYKAGAIHQPAEYHSKRTSDRQ